MDSCEYAVVKTTQRSETTKSILKQLLICSSVWTQFFMAGLCVGAPTVLIPQMREEANSTSIIDDEMSSWLYSTSSISAIPWIIILPIFSERIGRKVPQIIASINGILIFAVLYFSTNPYYVLLSQVLQGYLNAGNMSVTILIVTEYSSTKYRGVFLTVKSASFFWGIWVANAIGTFIHWTNIAILGLLCSIYTLSVFFWPESPSWLASKGKYDECRLSHRWIHGFHFENDLRQLIASTVSTDNKLHKNNGFKILRDPLFYKPLTISVISVTQYHFSAKIVCSLFILDIIKDITDKENNAYEIMLILDGVTVVGMYIGTFLSKVLKRRTLYMSSSFIGVAFLIFISAYLFLVKSNYILETNYLLLTLLSVYSVAISCGPVILSMSIYGEIIAVKYQAISYIIIAFSYAFYYFLLTKLTPAIFSCMGLDGAFLFYGVTCGLCTIYLFMYLPETKNKTRWEIEDIFKDRKRDNEGQEMIEH